MTPFKIMVFNKECLKADWDRCEKPDFIYFNCVELVLESDMTEQEKIDHPEATITGGYLKTLEYKEAFQRSYNKASDEDRSKIKKLPNFDSEIFYEISGIRV